MRRSMSSMAVAAAVTLSGCGLTSSDTDISLSLDPAAFELATRPGAAVGDSTPISVNPNELGGPEYTNNRNIDTVTVASLALEVVSVKATNVAARMTSGTVTITDEATHETHRYTFDPAVLPLPIVVGTYAMKVIAPVAGDPSPQSIDAFLSNILKNGHTFTMLVSGSLDQAPVDATCKVHLSVVMRVAAAL